MQNIILFFIKNELLLSAIILILLLLTPLFTRIHHSKGRYYMWLVVVIALIIPIHYPLQDFKLKLLLPSSLESFITSTNETSLNTTIPSEINTDPNFNPTHNANFDTNPNFNIDPNLNTLDVSSKSTDSLNPDTNLLTSLFHSFSPIHIVLIWFLGMIFFSIRLLISHLKFVHISSKWSYAISEMWIHTLFQELCTHYELASTIRLKYCKLITSPITVGLIHPLILLPQTHFKKDDLRMLLSHELIHCKRRDMLYKLVLNIAHILHWFNPLVYLMKQQIYFECETSCDETVLKNTSVETRFQYSEMMLDFARTQNLHPTLLSSAFFGKQALKQRLTLIMDQKIKRSGIIMITLVASCILFANSILGFEFTNTTPSLATQSLPTKSHAIAQTKVNSQDTSKLSTSFTGGLAPQLTRELGTITLNAGDKVTFTLPVPLTNTMNQAMPQPLNITFFSNTDTKQLVLYNEHQSDTFTASSNTTYRVVLQNNTDQLINYSITASSPKGKSFQEASNTIGSTSASNNLNSTINNNLNNNVNNNINNTMPLQNTLPFSYNQNTTHWTQGIVEMNDFINSASISNHQSGTFTVSEGKELVLYSTMQSGTFSFYLFSSDGTQVANVNAKEVDKTIQLSSGTWAYNYNVEGSHGLAFAVVRDKSTPIDIVMDKFELHK